MDEVPSKITKVGDPQFGATIEMIEAMRAAIVPCLERFADPREGVAIAMSAAAMFAGTHAGTLMAEGALRTQDRKRAGEMALANFRQGIDVGLSRGLRAAKPGGSA